MQTPIDKKKKLLLLLLFVVPVMSLIAWLMFNSMKGYNSKADAKQNDQAFNPKMPNANLKENTGNKLEIYMQAQKDSAKLKEQQEKDTPKFFDPGPPPSDEEVFADQYVPPAQKPVPTYRKQTSVEQNEQKVKDRLEKLQAALHSTEQKKEQDTFSWQQGDNQPTNNDQDVARLEKLLGALQTPDTTGDPEMKQLENMLDKLLDIQHPERVKERMPQNPAPRASAKFSVTVNPVPDPETMNQDSHDTANGFWGLQLEQPITTDNATIIKAVVHADQLVQDNSSIKLRLIQDIYINGKLIPNGCFISGVCRLSSDRVQVQLQDITYNNAIYPISLALYDTDGMEGIRVLGGTGHDIARDELNQSIQTLQFYNPDPTLASQAATNGIQALRSLLTKKGRKAQAGVKAGHKVLLKIKDNQ